MATVTFRSWPPTEGGSLVDIPAAEHFAGCRIHEMSLSASKAGDQLVGVVRHFLGEKSLYGLTSIRAAIEKWRHEVSYMTDHAGYRDLILIK